MVVQHAEGADQGRAPGRYPVAETMASGRTVVPPCRCTAARQTLDRRHNLNPSGPNSGHEAVIEDRHGTGPQVSEAIARWRRQAEIGEVRDREPAQ